jgi:hypothetical protein
MQCADVGKHVQYRYVPNNNDFWDYSKHWSTEYGPNYADVNTNLTRNMMPCELPAHKEYALCSESGPDPLACKVEKGSRFAICKCIIKQGLGFVNIHAILNHQAYVKTVEACGHDGARCIDTANKAPICQNVIKNTVIPGADLTSMWSPTFRDSLTASRTSCPRGPYLGCMTAPCKIRKVNGERFAFCSCVVMYGKFQLSAPGASCNLPDGLLWSASYTPSLDNSTICS